MKTPFQLLIILLLIGCASCTSYEAKTRIDNTLNGAVDQFHARLNEERYQEIYSQADEVLRSRITEAEFTSQLKSAHEQMGQTDGKALFGFEDSFWQDLRRIVGAKREVLSAVDYPKNDRIIAHEKYAWALENGQARLVSYEFRALCRKPCSLAFELK